MVSPPEKVESYTLVAVPVVLTSHVETDSLYGTTKEKQKLTCEKRYSDYNIRTLVDKH